eukprot:m.50057 g.50057  ORF g.50057 m.50057 type:complete len:413 (+) comp48052_c0_seq1:219-1457(+)
MAGKFLGVPAAADARARAVSLVDGQPAPTTPSASTTAHHITDGESTVLATKRSPHVQEKMQYATLGVIGEGAFGVVTKLQVLTPAYKGQLLALKRVLQDPRYKNRELDILLDISHVNIAELRWYFYTEVDKQTYLNIMMDYLPENLHDYIQSRARQRQRIPLAVAKLFTYQLLRGLGYLHSKDICHRDMKPQNILVDSATGTIKICDFGSAKILVAGQVNVAYICSRHYRAPELVFGAPLYTTAIDVWSAGCVLAELFLATPVFPGTNSVNQLVVIVKILGNPTAAEILAMNPKQKGVKLSEVIPKTLPRLFDFLPADESAELVPILKRLLRYTPTERPNACAALLEEFFQSLKINRHILGAAVANPPLFNFTPQGLLFACLCLVACRQSERSLAAWCPNRTRLLPWPGCSE